MDNKNYTQMLDLQKLLFNNTVELVNTFHNQSSNMIRKCIEKNPLLPEESKKIYDYISDGCQKHLEICKELTDSNFEMINQLFSTTTQKSPEQS
jgi:hypothetical protein